MNTLTFIPAAAWVPVRCLSRQLLPTAKAVPAVTGPNVGSRLLQQPQLLHRAALQHPQGVVRQPRRSTRVPARRVPGHLGVGLGQQLAVALLAVTKELGPSSAGAAGGDGVFVLGILDDAGQFLAEGQPHALVGAPGELGTRQLLVGDEVAFLEAVSVAAQGL